MQDRTPINLRAWEKIKNLNFFPCSPSDVSIKSIETVVDDIFKKN